MGFLVFPRTGIRFEVTHRPEAPVEATVLTRFPPDGRWSGGPPVPEDAEHARALFCSPWEHHVAHELAHNLVGHALWPSLGCPILHASAHGTALPPDADDLEWRLTALTYLAYDAEQRAPRDWGALIDLARSGVKVVGLARELHRLAKLLARGTSPTLQYEFA
jgi:hypothetical protein